MLNPLPEERIVVRPLSDTASVRRRTAYAGPLAPQRDPTLDPPVQQANVVDADPALDVPVPVVVLARERGAPLQDLGEVARAVDDDGAAALADEVRGEDPLEAVGEPAGLLKGHVAVEKEGFEEAVVDDDAVERLGQQAGHCAFAGAWGPGHLDEELSRH
jgi:hypothetical protein